MMFLLPLLKARIHTDSMPHIRTRDAVSVRSVNDPKERL